ncbi:MAG: hypothetical protein WDW38_000266 [Sanguina aurantia]
MSTVRPHSADPSPRFSAVRTSAAGNHRVCWRRWSALRPARGDGCAQVTVVAAAHALSKPFFVVARAYPLPTSNPLDLGRHLPAPPTATRSSTVSCCGCRLTKPSGAAPLRAAPAAARARPCCWRLAPLKPCWTAAADAIGAALAASPQARRAAAITCCCWHARQWRPHRARAANRRLASIAWLHIRSHRSPVRLPCPLPHRWIAAARPATARAPSGTFAAPLPADSARVPLAARRARGADGSLRAWRARAGGGRGLMALRAAEPPHPWPRAKKRLPALTRYRQLEPMPISPMPSEHAIARRIYIVIDVVFGLGFSILLLVMLVGALNYSNSAALLLTCLLGAASSTSMLSGFRNLDGLTLLQIRAGNATAGDPIEVALTIETSRLRQAVRLDLDAESAAFAIHANDTTVVKLVLPTSVRGWQPLPRLRIWTTWPIGLFRAWSWLRPDQSVLVWPRPPFPRIVVAQPATPLAWYASAAAPHAVPGADACGACCAVPLSCGSRVCIGVTGDRVDRAVAPPRANRVRAGAGTWCSLVHALHRRGAAVRRVGCAAADNESRIARLARWVGEAQAQRRTYSLWLPGNEIAAGAGHARGCMSAMATLACALVCALAPLLICSSRVATVVVLAADFKRVGEFDLLSITVALRCRAAAWHAAAPGLVLVLGWRCWQRQQQSGRVPAWLKLPLLGLLTLAVIVGFGNLFGREPGTALAIGLLVLKLLETETPRDVRVGVGFACFALMSALLIDQGLIATIVVALGLLPALATLRALEPAQTPASLPRTLVPGLLLLGAAIPMALLAFLLVPRLSEPLWGAPSAGDTGLLEHGVRRAVNNGALEQSQGTADAGVTLQAEICRLL